MVILILNHNMQKYKRHNILVLVQNNALRLPKLKLLNSVP